MEEENVDIKKKAPSFASPQDIADQLFQQANREMQTPESVNIRESAPSFASPQDIADQLFQQANREMQTPESVNIRESAPSFVSPQDIADRAMREVNASIEMPVKENPSSSIGETFDSNTFPRMTSQDVIDRMIAEMEKRNTEEADTSIESHSVRR